MNTKLINLRKKLVKHRKKKHIKKYYSDICSLQGYSLGTLMFESILPGLCRLSLGPFIQYVGTFAGILVIFIMNSYGRLILTKCYFLNLETDGAIVRH